MDYKIKSWIPCNEEENAQIFSDFLEVTKVLKHLTETQPDNLHKIEILDEESKVECYLCGTKEKESVAHDTWIPSFWHNEFKSDYGPLCPICSKRLQLDADGEPFLPVGG